MTAWTRGSSGSAPLVTLNEMKQVKSILVQHKIEVGKKKQKTKNQKPTNQKKPKPKHKKALIGFSVTISQIKGIWSNTNS